MKSQRYLEDKKSSVILFVFLFLLYAVVFMTKNMFSSAMASIVEEGFMSKSQTGLINAAFWFVYAPFQIVGGFAVDKYSPYKLIMIGLFGSALSNLVIYFNQSYYVMMAAWIFSAIVQFGIWPGVFKIISTQLTPAVRETGVFWLLFSTSVGLGMSMLLASFVTHWQQNFLVSTISLLLMIVAYAVLNHILDKRMVEEEVVSDNNNANEQIKKEPMLPLMLSSGLVAFLILTILRGSIDNGIKMMAPVMLMETYESLSAAISARLSTVLVIFSAIGTLLTGFMRMKVTKNESKAQICLYALGLLPLGIVCFLGRIHYIWILSALSVAIMLIHGAAPFSQSFVALHFKKYGRIGTVSGILNAAASMGNILASYVFARMAELMSWGEVAMSWIIIVAVCLLVCVVVLPRWTRFTKV